MHKMEDHGDKALESAVESNADDYAEDRKPAARAESEGQQHGTSVPAVNKAASSVAKAKKAGRKTRAKKKPRDMPRRPLSAYNCFFREKRNIMLAEKKKARKVKGECEEGCVEKEPNLFASMGKEIAKLWKELKPKESEKYKVMAEADMLRYREEMEEYHRKVARKTRLEAQDLEKEYREMKQRESGNVPVVPSMWESEVSIQRQDLRPAVLPQIQAPQLQGQAPGGLPVFNSSAPTLQAQLQGINPAVPQLVGYQFTMPVLSTYGIYNQGLQSQLSRASLLGSQHQLPLQFQVPGSQLLGIPTQVVYGQPQGLYAAGILADLQQALVQEARLEQALVEEHRRELLLPQNAGVLPPQNFPQSFILPPATMDSIQQLQQADAASAKGELGTSELYHQENERRIQQLSDAADTGMQTHAGLMKKAPPDEEED